MRIETRAVLTLDELLARGELGMSLVSGGDHVGRPVAGVSILEGRETAGWPMPGWVILADADRLDAERQRELVRRAARTCLSAVAVRAAAPPPATTLT